MIYIDGKLWSGYDYKNQAWVLKGCYIACGHPEKMRCGCYGRKNAGTLCKITHPKNGW